MAGHRIPKMAGHRIPKMAGSETIGVK